MQSLEEMETELARLEQHIKTYHVGYYPIFYFTRYHGVHASPLYAMQLYDFFEERPEEQGIKIKVKNSVDIGSRTIVLSNQDRLMLTWYLLQRIPVMSVTVKELEKPFCVNRDHHTVQAPAYRKALERASKELNLKQIYNTALIKAAYAYEEIACGHQTLEGIAALFGYSRLYMQRYLCRLFPDYAYEESVIAAITDVSKENLQTLNLL